MALATFCLLSARVVKINVYSCVIYAQTVNDRFFMFEEIETDAILSLDEGAQLVSDEVCMSRAVFTIFLQPPVSV